MSLEGSLEENVLTLLCFSKTYATDVALEVDTALFTTTAYRKIAEKAAEYLVDYGKPAAGHLRDILETQIKKSEEGKLISATIQAMEELYPGMNEQFILDQLAFFARKSRMAKQAQEYAQLVHQGKLDEAEAVLEYETTNKNSSIGIWAHEPDAMLGFMDQAEEDEFTFGIDTLDQMLCRPARGTLSALLAPAKAGKSWFLVNAAKANLLKRRSVLHVTLENSEKLTAKRYVQNLYALTKEKSEATRTPRFVKNKAGQLTDIVFNDLEVPEHIGAHSKRWITRRLSNMKAKPRLLIKEFPTFSLTIAQLNAYLDMLDRKFNFRPDVLIIDYPDLMAIKSTEKRIEIGNHFAALRGICQRRKMAGITVTQVNRKGADATLVTATHVAEDWSKIATCDNILTFNRTKHEKRLGLARVLVAAARDAEDGYVALIAQNYKTGQFCLDSIYHSAEDEGLIANATGEGNGRSTESD